MGAGTPVGATDVGEAEEAGKLGPASAPVSGLPFAVQAASSSDWVSAAADAARSARPMPRTYTCTAVSHRGRDTVPRQCTTWRERVDGLPGGYRAHVIAARSRRQGNAPGGANDDAL